MNSHQRRKARRRTQKLVREIWDAVQATPADWKELPMLQWHRRWLALLDDALLDDK